MKGIGNCLGTEPALCGETRNCPRFSKNAMEFSWIRLHIHAVRRKIFPDFLARAFGRATSARGVARMSASLFLSDKLAQGVLREGDLPAPAFPGGAFSRRDNGRQPSIRVPYFPDRIPLGPKVINRNGLDPYCHDRIWEL